MDIEKAIVVDWVKEETQNNVVVVKKSNKRCWRTLNYIAIFLLGFLIGFLSLWLIYENMT